LDAKSPGQAQMLNHRLNKWHGNKTLPNRLTKGSRVGLKQQFNERDEEPQGAPCLLLLR
jgi:hypothetical protein